MGRNVLRCRADILGTIPHFAVLKYPNHHIKMAALMLPLLTEAIIEEKTILVQTDIIPGTVEDHKLFNNIWIQASRHIIINTDGEEQAGKSCMIRSHWVTDISYNCRDL